MRKTLNMDKSDKDARKRDRREFKLRKRRRVQA